MNSTSFYRLGYVVIRCNKCQTDLMKHLHHGHPYVFTGAVVYITGKCLHLIIRYSQKLKRIRVNKEIV